LSKQNKLSFKLLILPPLGGCTTPPSLATPLLYRVLIPASDRACRNFQ